MAYKSTLFFPLLYGCTGTPVTARYLCPGGGNATNANTMRVPILFACDLVEARVRCRVAPGGAVVDTYTVENAGVATACAPTVTGAAVDGTWSGHVTIAAGSSLSVLCTIGGGSAADDVQVTLILRPVA